MQRLIKFYLWLVEKDFIKPNYETLLDVHEIVEMFENEETQKQHEINVLLTQRETALKIIEKLYTCKLGEQDQEEIRHFLKAVNKQ